MAEFNRSPSRRYRHEEIEVPVFLDGTEKDIDARTVRSFGSEWKKFSKFSDEEIEKISREYFDLLPQGSLGPETRVLDLGCGSGRWSLALAPRVGQIDAVDPSLAVITAARMLRDYPHVRVSCASAENLPFDDSSFDLIICLGVLHHATDTRGALQAAVRKLRPDGHFLLYLYYDLSERGHAYRALFRVSDLFRRVISSSPFILKSTSSDLIACTVYWPLSRFSRLCKSIFPNAQWPRSIPLSYYSDKSFKILRNDALDRFGTPLEKRYSRAEIEDLMRQAGLTDIVFSEQAPYWHALGKRSY